MPEQNQTFVPPATLAEFSQAKIKIDMQADELYQQVRKAATDLQLAVNAKDKEIAELKKEIAELKKEIAELKKEVANPFPRVPKKPGKN
jgi:peptidoglycan hydrolase CwlO-like protein